MSDAMQDLARVERQIARLVKTHGPAAVRRHFKELPMGHWNTWQRVHGLIERYANKFNRNTKQKKPTRKI